MTVIASLALIRVAPARLRLITFNHNYVTNYPTVMFSTGCVHSSHPCDPRPLPLTRLSSSQAYVPIGPILSIHVITPGDACLAYA